MRLWPFRRVTAAQKYPLREAISGVDPQTARALLQLAGYTSTQLPTVTTPEQAMAVPSLNNGVTLFMSIVNQLELSTDGEPHRSDTFLARLDPDFAPGWTRAWTVWSLLWHRVAWWQITSYDASGFPASCRWLDNYRVQVTPPSAQLPAGGIRVDGQPVNLKDIVRFDGVKPGLLEAPDAIATAVANLKAATTIATNPVPAWVLVDTNIESEPLDPADAAKYVADVAGAVKTRGGAYVAGVKPEPMGWNSREMQLVEARQQDAVEMARLLGIPTKYVAAPAQGAEQVYSNMAEVRRDLFDMGGLPSYLVPIEQRLSMPDITPRGKRVTFDQASFFGQVVPTVTSEQPALEDTEQLTPVSSIARRTTAREAQGVVPVSHRAPAGAQQSYVTAADAERRIIEGVIVPWDAVGHAALDGLPCMQSYSEGSLTWETREDGKPDVPLVINHTGGAPVFAGVCERIWSDTEGLHGRWRVVATRAGDDALAEATEKLRTGLSLEAIIPMSYDVPQDGDILSVTAGDPALLERTALVDKPAFTAARVRSAIANQNGRPAAAADVPDETLSTTIEGLNGAAQAITAAANTLAEVAAAGAGVPSEESGEGGGETAAARPPAAGTATASTAVTKEPYPYGHGAATSGLSFFKDLLHAKDDPEAHQRVSTAMKMQAQLNEHRHATAGWRPGLRVATAADEAVPVANVFIPNQYDLSLYVQQLTYPRKLVQNTPTTTISGPAPFLYPFFASATADGGSGEIVAAHVASTNPASGELDIDSKTAQPVAYDGKLDIERPAVDGGAPGMDQILFGALGESYNQVTELAAWTALYATSGITAPTDVTSNADLEVEARAMAKQVRQEVAAFDVRRGISPDRIFFGAGVWSSALGADSASASGEPLYPYFNPTNRAAAVSGRGAVQVDVYGVPGESATQATSAKVTQVSFGDLHAWEGLNQMFRWEEVAGPSKIRFVLFNYFVFKVVQPKGVTVHTQL